MATRPNTADDDVCPQLGERLSRSRLYGDLSDSSETDSDDPVSPVSELTRRPSPPIDVSRPQAVSTFPTNLRSGSLSSLSSSTDSDLFKQTSGIDLPSEEEDVADKFTAVFTDIPLKAPVHTTLSPFESSEDTEKDKNSQVSAVSSEALRYSRTATEEIFTSAQNFNDDIFPGAQNFAKFPPPSETETDKDSISTRSTLSNYEPVSRKPPSKNDICTVQPTAKKYLQGAEPPGEVDKREGNVQLTPPAAADVQVPFLTNIMTKLCCFRKADRNQQYAVSETEAPAQFSWDQPNRPDPKLYTFEKRSDETLVRNNGEIGGQQFTVDNCKNCTILLFDWSASITIDDCENCLFVLGPCTGSVFVRTTKECTILSVSQQFRTRDCSDLALFLFCVTQPTIEESNNIQFSPLYLFYNDLGNQLRKAGISPFNNNWKRVHDFSATNKCNYRIVSEGPLAVPHIAPAVGTSGFNVDNATSELISCPKHVNCDDRAMVVCTQTPNESLGEFYSRLVKLTHMLSEQLELLECRDVKIKKGELKSLLVLKTFSKYEGRLVLLEFRDENAYAKINPYVVSGVFLVEKERVAEYQKVLHRFSEVQEYV
ncbi:hypothetical protein L596_005213 [Steinernema carpocapsae]|uniref:C-CAP/cofactor C-like domain-containing protein n=1 Tax=Steinernema carpocapsae TaxID=34508 RepID=A0A4U8UZV2_STECR|nr:hypothetical protein L596_005213 [Steinernema carpocapsae]